MQFYYFIRSGVNYADFNDQNLIFSTSGCNINSFFSQINKESLEPDNKLLQIFEILLEMIQEQIVQRVVMLLMKS